jgi:methyl-galactoside transport system substrate-binding protein
MKKFMALLLSVVLMTSLFIGCGSKTEEATDTPDTTTTAPAATEAPTATEAPAAPEAKVVKVGITIYKFDDNFMTLYREELERYFKEDLSNDEVTYEVTVVDGKNDQAEQTNQIQTFIADKFDVIFANLVQSSVASTVVNMCKDEYIVAGR